MKLAPWLIAAATNLLVASVAQAGGLYLTERGVEGLGRAGANVAGADRFDAIGYNVAGLSGTGIAGDFTQLVFDVRYRRELLIQDSEGAGQRVYSPTIEGETGLLPLPTLIGAYTTEDGRYTFAGGMFTPTFALASFPASVDGQPSPARYTLSGFTDSRMLLLGAWFSARINDKLAVGAGVHALVGTFRSSLDFSLSLPDRLLAAPEDPDYDARGRINVGPTVAPSGTIGLRYTPIPELALGLSGDLPIWLDSDAEFDVRLPSAAVFDTVSVAGNQAHVSMTLAPILRAGIQYKPIDALALEIAYVRELWSLHDEILVSPRGVEVRDIPGGPEAIVLPEIPVERGFVDSNSYRFGVEYEGSALQRTFVVRSGVSYEQSAVPPEYLSLSSLDFDKVLLPLGLGVELWQGMQVDVTYAHLLLKRENVPAEDAALSRVQPLDGNAPFEPVNGGSYRARANVISAGFSYVFR